MRKLKVFDENWSNILEKVCTLVAIELPNLNDATYMQRLLGW